MEIRNIAIIAHVDHGKTTLTDAILKQTGAVAEGTSMDSNALEKERGITIYSKNCSIRYKDTKINIVDTPGHQDFGSEVERVLRAVDTVLLVVDAQEGPMPQTRFVLKKSLELGLKPIVIINKIDKPAARIKDVENEVLELFLELGATDDQCNFTTLFAVGREGWAKRKMEDTSNDLTPLLDTIIEEVKPSGGKENTEAGIAQPFNLAYDNFLGRMAICRIHKGIFRTGQDVFVKNPEGVTRKGKITKLFTFEGISRLETNDAGEGDIVMIAGIPDIFIGESISTDENAAQLPAIKIDEPTISLFFLVNDSPFGGREGKFVTSRQIRDRLEKELEVNVGLKVDFSENDRFKVSGRGELHIGILLENMRREGFELQVSEPEVITEERDGVKFEPFEEVVIDVPKEMSGTIIGKLTERRGSLMNVKSEHGGTTERLTFEMPTRGLLGFRGQFIIDTKGLGILSSRFIEFRAYAGEIKRQAVGAMISMMPGKCLAFSLDNLQQRGTLYMEPSDEVYEGQVIGNTSKGEDLYVNPTKGKQLTNMRASGSDEGIFLAPAWKLSIERVMEIMQDDEYMEVTPKSVRLRKKILSQQGRSKAER